MKRCVLCKYFRIEFPERGYSEYTPGTEGSLRCTQGVGIFATYNYNFRKMMNKVPSVSLLELQEQDFYEALKTAETCFFYEERVD